MNMKDALAGPTAVDRNEEEAIARARRGDAGAFECLYKAHCRHVYSVCLRMIRNPAEAEDLTQQTFLQVFRKIGTFRGQSGFSTWLHRVTVNIVLMHMRRRKRTEVLFEDLDHPGSDDEAPREFSASDTSMFGAIDRLNLGRAIRRLPSGYKRFFLLYDVIGYEHKEIAERLRCSAGCSKSQLHKARRRLRQLLRGEERSSLDVAAG
jgi:RNA polymerase sigma-70 factor (ECF subfamily)